MIAAASGAGPLILPYAFSSQALAETQAVLAYEFALVDHPQSLPDGVVAIDLQRLPEPDPLQPPQPIGFDDVWVYLFTGGSTGNPQTWSKTARNLLAEADNLAATFDVTAQDTILATVPAHHIYGLLYSVLMPLVSGAQVVSATPSFPNEIIQALEQFQASILISIPAHYRALKTHPMNQNHLRMAFSSAGALAPDDDLGFYKAAGIAITEIYGSTETGGIAHRCRGRGQIDLKPFDCVDWNIEKERLWVKSNFLSPELKKSDAGFFNMADRVTAAPDQSFNLLGRSDGIVKVAGKRVDLSAIQQALKSIPGVRDAYVFSRAVGKSRENEILALVASELQVEKLRAALQPKLEPYAQPRQICVVARIPMSKVGKYDRAAIEQLFLQTP